MYSEHEISIQMGCSTTLPSTKLMTYSDWKKKSGHSSKTTSRDDPIKSIVPRSPTSSCKIGCTALLFKDTDVNRMTVSCRLVNEFKLISCKPASEQRLWKWKRRIWHLSKSTDIEQRSTSEMLSSLMNLYCSSLLCISIMTEGLQERVMMKLYRQV